MVNMAGDIDHEHVCPTMTVSRKMAAVLQLLGRIAIAALVDSVQF